MRALILAVALVACAQEPKVVPLAGNASGAAEGGSDGKPSKVVSLSGTATATGGGGQKRK